MKKNLFLAVALFTAVACQQTPNQTTNDASAPEEEAPAVTFNEENLPDTPLDLNAYSAGIQHIGLLTSTPHSASN